MIRTVVLTAGIVALGAWLAKSASPRAALPPADGPLGTARGDADPQALLDGIEQARPAALEAGLPTDRYSDADHVRPGFADYARGA